MELLGIYTRMSSQAAYHVNPLFTRVPRVAHVKCRAGIVVCRTRRPPSPPHPPAAAAVSRKEATVSPTAVDGGKQRTANLLLCACYQIRQAGSFINETNVGHPRQANTRGRKATPPPSRGLFAFFKRGFERKKSYSISCAPPSSCCVQSPPASLPLPPQALFLPPRSPPLPPFPRPSSCGTL